VALVEVPMNGSAQSVLILRDIEMHRARQHARVDRVACPKDFEPAAGLSGDRETATAQAAAECLRRAGVKRVVADRTLPLIYAEFARRAGIDVDCDTELYVAERRQKRPEEIDRLREAQRDTEAAVRMACELIARAKTAADGALVHDGSPLTCERVRAAIDHFLLDRGYANPTAIVAAGPTGADCHNVGSGEIRTSQSVIIDVFPRNRQTLYNGDCTRTVVHGEVPDETRKMHAVVCEAKAAAIAAARAGVTGEDVHRAASAVITRHGFAIGLPGDDAPLSYCGMTHGTGHGIGLDVHEPPLLDMNGPVLLAGDALTIEPGLYRRDLGAVRVEDMVIVTDGGCENLNTISESLQW
jgi:Xaa-Pro aminopeptidase